MNNALNSFSLKGKIAIVTGGYGHLGKAFSEALYEAGAKVVIAGHNKKKYERIFSKREKEDYHYQEMDISDSISIKDCFESIVKKFGKIDILVNNAVYLKGQFPEKITDQELSYSLDGVLGNVYRCIREVMPYMKVEKAGNIINVASMYGVVVPDLKLYEGDCKDFFNPPHYGASKAGVIQLTKYFAEYLIPYNIRVNAISPGAFPGEEVKANKEFVDRLSKKNPYKRVGIPADLKGTVIYLASDASKYVIGQNIQVDGGWTLW